MASGVKVDQEIVEAYSDFKLGKKLAYMVFGFSEDSKRIVILEKVAKPAGSEKNPLWKQFVESLPANDVRYALADVDGSERTEMVFITWAPDTAPIKRKMLVASSKDALRNVLVGCKNAVQATSYPDLELGSVTERFKSTV